MWPKVLSIERKEDSREKKAANLACNEGLKYTAVGSKIDLSIFYEYQRAGWTDCKESKLRFKGILSPKNIARTSVSLRGKEKNGMVHLQVKTIHHSAEEESHFARLLLQLIYCAAKSLGGELSITGKRKQRLKREISNP